MFKIRRLSTSKIMIKNCQCSICTFLWWVGLWKFMFPFSHPGQWGLLAVSKVEFVIETICHDTNVWLYVLWIAQHIFLQWRESKYVIALLAAYPASLRKKIESSSRSMSPRPNFFLLSSKTKLTSPFVRRVAITTLARRRLYDLKTHVS